ncbi:MAG: hypothetical protein HIU89_00460 [Proteobacteria bacterium]|nr:hypothetical protein [Pseudomonadota bacterium]
MYSFSKNEVQTPEEYLWHPRFLSPPSEAEPVAHRGQKVQQVTAKRIARALQIVHLRAIDLCGSTARSSSRRRPSDCATVLARL